MLRQFQALPREFIEVRRGRFSAVEADIRPAEVIRQNEDNIRPIWRRLERRANNPEQ
jgi:hypothetical protein